MTHDLVILIEIFAICLFFWGLLDGICCLLDRMALRKLWRLK